jgi:hypothetical protein
VELYLHSHNTPLWRDAELKKHRVKFYFTFALIGPVNYNYNLYRCFQFDVLFTKERIKGRLRPSPKLLNRLPLNRYSECISKDVARI